MTRQPGKASRLWYILLLIPVIATLWPPFFNSVDPKLAGMPYFYWYQLLWVVLSAILTYIVYAATKSRS
jgi:hypothetical protein